MTDWTAQMRQDAAFAKTILLSQGEVRPMFIVHCPDHIKVVGAGWRTAEEKRTTQKLIAMQAALEDADAICFIAEAWARDIQPIKGESDADHRRRATEVTPSQAKDRIEVIIVSVVYREDGEAKPLCTSLEIIRDKQGKAVDAVERPGDKATLAGPMFDMLLPEKLNDRQKDIVRRALDTLKEISGYTEIHDQFIHPAGHA